MFRKAWLVVLGATLAAGAVVWWSLGGSSSGDAQPPSSSPPSIVVRVPEDDGEQRHLDEVRTLLVDLPSELAAGRADGLVPELADRSDLTVALPADSVLTPDMASWRRTGDVASILTTISRSGNAEVRFTVLVERVDDRWKVAGTYQGVQR